MPAPARFSTRILWPVAFLAIVAGLFYWFQIRPIRVYRQCTVDASADARTLLKNKAEIAKGTPNEAQYRNLISRNLYLRSDYQSFLRKCLLYYGIPPVSLEAEMAESSNQGASELQ